MGMGFDTLTARKGTNADLRVFSPFEAIETQNRNSLLTLLDGGTRILIADPSLHVNVVHLISDQFSSLSQNRRPNIDVQWANETPNICQPYLGIDFSSAHTMAGVSMIESSINGLRLNYASDECRDVSVDLNLGYYAVSAAAGSAATEDVGVFGFGSAFSFDLAENTSAKLYSNLGLLDGSIRRRIMNNTLDSGFEYGTGAFNGWFVNSGTLIETDLVRSDYSLTPYAAAELGFAKTSRFSEMDTSFGLDINEHSSFRYRVATGVEATSTPFQWNDNAFVQFSGSVSTLYSERIDTSTISSSLANEAQPLIESGPYSELSVDLGAKIQFWSDNRNSKAEFQFLHRNSNRNSSSNSISGSFALVF
ncbi:MAG: autotransporter outer membrane beta-barrel domain-containing protein [Pseudomonadota bacterium]